MALWSYCKSDNIDNNSMWLWLTGKEGISDMFKFSKDVIVKGLWWVGGQEERLTIGKRNQWGYEWKYVEKNELHTDMNNCLWLFNFFCTHIPFSGPFLLTGFHGGHSQDSEHLLPGQCDYQCIYPVYTMEMDLCKG